MTPAGDKVRSIGSAAVIYDAHDDVATITMSQPKSRNALSPGLIAALQEAMQRATADGVRALVLAADGSSFCAGGDLAAVGEINQDDYDVELAAIVDQLHAMMTTLRSVPMPTVAAVDGAAIGAGVALALATDVRVLSKSASFMTGYLAVGASPDGGSSYHLSRSLGSNQALSGFLLNRRFTADDLQRSGLADLVVDDGQVLTSALGLARQLSTISPEALQAVRELVEAASGQSFADHLDDEKVRFLKVAQTQGFRDGIAPFARKPPASMQA